MPREIPRCPPKPNPIPEAGRRYEIELITPMVGGGASPGELDPRFPIRPTAIRGQLRYWWRLIRGRTLGDGMWRREEEIFGSTEFPSPLTVCVESFIKTETFDPSDQQIVDRFGAVAYALFASIQNKQRVAKEGIKFTLLVQTAGEDELLRRRKAQNEQRRRANRPALPLAIASIKDDIQGALNAWLAFGGIGGRTRRGCGAVHSRSLAGSLPQLPARIFLGSPQQSASAAWQESLSVYREFRQAPRGRVHQKTIQTRSGPRTIRVPGRSHWPEADSIRQITGCSLKPPRGISTTGVPVDEDPRDHSTPVVPSDVLPAFPKAILGLPINYHFADGPNKDGADANLDPKDVQLYPLISVGDGRSEKAERMASPIITRPLWIDGKWRPAIVVLTEKLPDGFQVRVEGKNALPGGHLSHDVPLHQIVDMGLSRLTPMRGKATAIDALIEFLLKEKKWSKG